MALSWSLVGGSGDSASPPWQNERCDADRRLRPIQRKRDDAGVDARGTRIIADGTRRALAATMQRLRNSERLMPGLARTARLVAALLTTSAALSAGATSYVFDVNLAGGSDFGSELTGSFSGVDANGDRVIDQTELTAFSVSYHPDLALRPDAYPFTIAEAPTSFHYGFADFDFVASNDATGDLIIVTPFDERVDTLTFSDSGENPKGTFLHISPVPEPATWALMAMGLAGMALSRRRHRHGSRRYGAAAKVRGLDSAK